MNPWLLTAIELVALAVVLVVVLRAVRGKPCERIVLVVFAAIALGIGILAQYLGEGDSHAYRRIYWVAASICAYRYGQISKDKD